MSWTTLVLLAALSSMPETAAIDLDRYLGTWYEFARFDHFFERGCVGTTARYEKRKDGDLRVVNECRSKTLQGKLKVIEGKAWVPDPKEPGKLEVQFFWPFHGPYWVLEVAEDYSWALVGNEDKDSCWVLTRTPTVDEGLYQQLVEKLRARGYAVDKLLRVPQLNTAKP